jgi:hypothetical protein
VRKTVRGVGGKGSMGQFGDCMKSLHFKIKIVQPPLPAFLLFLGRNQRNSSAVKQAPRTGVRMSNCQEEREVILTSSPGCAS